MPKKRPSSGSKPARKVTYVTLFADESLNPKYEAALKRLEGRLGESHPMHIGGREVWSDAGEFEVRSPIDTSIVVGRFQVGTKEHARASVAAAKVGFDLWGAKTWKERVRAFDRYARLVDERKFDIAAAITYEVGKNRLEALAECWEAMDAVKYYTGVMRKEKGYAIKMGPGGPGERNKDILKPHGVWPIISPFNFPFMLANGMAMGALMTGNSVILKPTSSAPLTGLMLYQLYVDAGVTLGAVNYVTGPGGNFEDEFVSNPDVDGIAFTGSRDVGMRLFRRFHTEQPYPKPILLEMGSKNPTIVTAKADIAKAVEGTVRAAFGYGGQKCSATSRIYVQKEVKDRFLAALKERVESVTVGDPRQKETFMGPVINVKAVDTFRRAVDDAKRSGGHVVAGGSVLEGGKEGNGFYVSPTVVADLPEESRLVKDELFIPFVVVNGFTGLDDALHMANSTDYGLTAGIFTKDKEEIKKFFDEIEFGVTYANRSGGSTTGAWPGAQSFTGWKASGATGKGVGSPYYLLTFLRDQSQTDVA
ncbi:MAG: aldehyde dehydrogenase family protein [Nitrososphaerota archaeon]|jgi:1-pyrroline-5-carboxylate dehydrogenase|nr:aldehyde dehydrogenase family protein [Nitrososphaerota archaeon]MDG6942825.1 aldehyde dehydrogenase family protein [Nitrososphaerota archaeon]MDG6950855.1 aldehyde dehydrogenase family protein [Nitrososphaerota archaeon]